MPGGFSVAVVLALSLFGGKTPDDWLPSRDDVNYLERGLTLPPDASGPIGSYDRFYTGRVEANKRLIHAQYVYVGLLGSSRPSDGVGRIHIVAPSAMPSVANGGCGVIDFDFDLHSTHPPALYCNPVAEQVAGAKP